MNDLSQLSGKELQEKLTWEAPNIAEKTPEQFEEAAAFCEGYKRFLDRAKTEREFVRETVKLIEAAGYRAFDPQAQYKAGDKVYVNNRGKAMILTTFGTKGAAQGVRINAAHIDSPRLDLKPSPLYEKSDLALFKTHYYGGIRKYQWTATPLALHGVVMKRGGGTAEICIGEDPADPVFCVSDLLPHLAAEQNKRTLAEGIKGEELNVIVGSLPFADDEKLKEPVKLMVLKLLYEKYGITEKDFIRAEIEMVPAVKARDVGLDRSMVGAYGQDDRVCAYTALMAELEAEFNRDAGDRACRQGGHRLRGKYGAQLRFPAAPHPVPGAAGGGGLQAGACGFRLPVLGCERGLRPHVPAGVGGEKQQLFKQGLRAHQVHRRQGEIFH